MSNHVYRWNVEQVKLHNIKVRPIEIRNLSDSNDVKYIPGCGHITGIPVIGPKETDSKCFKQYMCARNTCINDAAPCQYITCNEKTNEYFDKKTMCYYNNNNPNDNIYTYNIYDNKSPYGYTQ